MLEVVFLMIFKKEKTYLSFKRVFCLLFSKSGEYCDISKWSWLSLAKLLYWVINHCKSLLWRWLLRRMLWLLDDLKFVSKLMQFLIKLFFLLLEALQDVIYVKSLSLTVFISLSKWFLYFYLRIHRAIKNLRLSLSSELFIGCLESLNANLWLQERSFRGSKSTTSPIYLLSANYLRL